jgi:hypothetical protein
VHVVVVLALVELMIRSVTLPRLSRMLGVRLDLEPGPHDVEPLPLTTLAPSRRRQLRCTSRVADAWPFSRGPCLRRALVGGHLVRDLHPTVRLGVAGAGDAVVAHAWLEIDGHPLEDVSAYTAFRRSEGVG